MFDNLILAREAAVAVFPINRPQVLNALFGRVVFTDDMREGAAVFPGKRKPVFKGK
jgi:hypothetical protein